MRKLLLSLALALILVVSFAVPVFAAPSADVTITATPTYLSITIAPNTWTINGSPGDAKIDLNTVYYSNAAAVVDTTPPSATVLIAECLFVVTNGSNVISTLTGNLPDFTGGGAMTNIGTGYANNGANAFGASTYITGSTWPTGAVVLAATGSAAIKTSLAVSTNLEFGIAFKSQSGAFTSGAAQTGVCTVTATET